jgi:hypothetical protein
MHAPKRLAATLVAAAALAAAVPAGASAAPIPSFAPPAIPSFAPPDMSNLCIKGVPDMGPLGPMGPYGPDGPWGADGPLHGQPNPLGNVAECGGALTFILRGGTIDSFVQANIPH